MCVCVCVCVCVRVFRYIIYVVNVWILGWKNHWYKPNECKHESCIKNKERQVACLDFTSQDTESALQKESWAINQACWWLRVIIHKTWIKYPAQFNALWNWMAWIQKFPHLAGKQIIVQRDFLLRFMLGFHRSFIVLVPEMPSEFEVWISFPQKKMSFYSML